MICPKCHSENKPGAKFCTRCGARLEEAKPAEQADLSVPDTASNPSVLMPQPKKPKKNRKTAGIVLTAVVLVAGICVGIWLSSKTRGTSEGDTQSYQEVLTTADRYYNKLDYVQAEEYYLKAMDIAPKEKEPYVRLYEVYIVTEEPQKAEDVLMQAEENLEPEVYTEVLASAQTLQDEQEQQVLVDSLIEDDNIANMNWTPPNYKDIGWIVRIGDKYGLYSPEGEWLVQPGYTYCEYMEFTDAVNFGFRNEDASSYSKYDTRSYTDGVSYSTSNGLSGYMSGFGGTTACWAYVYQGIPMRSCERATDHNAMVREELAEVEFYQGKTLLLHEYTGDINSGNWSDYANLDGNPLYFYIESTGEVFGPFAEGQYLTYETSVDEEYYTTLSAIPYQNVVVGLFAFENEDGAWSLYNQDGTKHLDGFDSVNIISYDCAICEIDGKYQVIDQDLNVTYVSSTGEVSSVINGKALIKNGDSWYMIDAAAPEQSENQEDTAEAEAAEDWAKEAAGDEEQGKDEQSAVKSEDTGTSKEAADA